MGIDGVRPESIEVKAQWRLSICHLFDLFVCHIKSQANATMAIGIMAPLHRIFPRFAEAQESSLLGLLFFGCPQCRPFKAVVGSCHELKRIIQFVDPSDLQPSKLKVFKSIFRADEVVDSHRAPRSPIPTVPPAISSIRSRLFFAASRSSSSISIRGCKSRSATYSFSSVFSAI